MEQNFTRSQTTKPVILIIEDDVPFCEALTEIFDIEGINAYFAQDGITGESVYREHQDEINLVILDLQIPLQDGVTTLHNLQNISPNINIMITSGRSEIEINEQISLTNKESITVLPKPFRVNTLLRNIHRVIDA